MQIPEIIIDDDHLPVERFREMDYMSVKEYQLPIELMMENAGLHLARLVTYILPSPGKVLIGVGPGNNGGGGLVAARRLAAWDYIVTLDLPEKEINSLPELQLARAMAAGVKMQPETHPDIFVDSYLGFSQRLPLSTPIHRAVDRANKLECSKISLDIPTGFNYRTGESIFKPDVVLTLAAMKTELLKLGEGIDVFLADLGIPAIVYKHFNIRQPIEFRDSGILHCKIPHK